MRNRKAKHPNALKHGVFAKMAFLPFEDSQEFTQLHDALIEEWMPNGPTEDDAVYSIAMGMWRKRRMQYWLSTEILGCRLDPVHSIYDEANALSVFRKMIATAPDDFERAFKVLPARIGDHLRQKVPRQNSQSTLEWVNAVQNEVTSVFLPAAEEHAAEVAAQDAANHPGLKAVRSAMFFTKEVIEHEVAVEARIDAMIDRAIKRLVHAKAMKEILGRSFPNGGDDQPKKIQSRKSNGSAKVVNHRDPPADSA